MSRSLDRVSTARPAPQVARDQSQWAGRHGRVCAPFTMTVHLSRSL